MPQWLSHCVMMLSDKYYSFKQTAATSSLFNLFIFSATLFHPCLEAWGFKTFTSKWIQNTYFWRELIQYGNRCIEKGVAYLKVQAFSFPLLLLFLQFLKFISHDTKLQRPFSLFVILQTRNVKQKAIMLLLLYSSWMLSKYYLEKNFSSAAFGFLFLVQSVNTRVLRTKQGQ